MNEYIDVVVRPILRAGGEPFSVIMAALERLEPGQGLRLYATFKPVPLFAVMADEGFATAEQALDGGEWKILFTPAETRPEQVAIAAGAPDFDGWPEAAVKLDSRNLSQPEHRGADPCFNPDGVTYELTVRAPSTRGCPATDFLKDAVADTAARIPGVETVDVVMTFEPPWTPSCIEPAIRLRSDQLKACNVRSADLARFALHQRRRVADVLSGNRFLSGRARSNQIRSNAMINRVTMVAIAFAAFLSSAPACAHDIVLSQAWSRATPKGAKVAAGYLTIENHGAEPDRLVAASSAAAAKVEIHQMAVQDGIMTMRPLDDGLLVPPDAAVTLEPGGVHVMFVGITAPFEEGQRIPVELSFERAGTVQTVFEVGSIGAKGPRLQIASTKTSAEAAPPKQTAIGDPFFTHICGARVMANVTVTPGRRRSVVVLVQLEDGDEKPLEVDALSVTLSNPDKNIAPVTVAGERLGADSWLVHMTADAQGKWSLSLGINVTQDDRIDIAAPILIE